MSEVVGEPLLLYTLYGWNAEAFPKIMRRAGRDFGGAWKINTFLRAPESPEGIEQALGLDLREVFCTVSRFDPAVTYHRPYGLVLTGQVRGYYDDDTGKVLQEDGEYSGGKYDFASEITKDELMNGWYEKFQRTERFIWNEAILAKGARVIAAFYDPKADATLESYDYSPFGCRERELFLEKAKKSGLSLVQIAAKF